MSYYVTKDFAVWVIEQCKESSDLDSFEVLSKAEKLGLVTSRTEIEWEYDGELKGENDP